MTGSLYTKSRKTAKRTVRGILRTLCMYTLALLQRYNYANDRLVNETSIIAVVSQRLCRSRKRETYFSSSTIKPSFFFRHPKYKYKGAQNKNGVTVGPNTRSRMRKKRLVASNIRRPKKRNRTRWPRRRSSILDRTELEIKRFVCC